MSVSGVSFACTDVFAGLLPLLTGNWALCGSVDDVFSYVLDEWTNGGVPMWSVLVLPTTGIRHFTGCGYSMWASGLAALGTASGS